MSAISSSHQTGAVVLRVIQDCARRKGGEACRIADTGDRGAKGKRGESAVWPRKGRKGGLQSHQESGRTCGEGRGAGSSSSRRKKRGEGGNKSRLGSCVFGLFRSSFMRARAEHITDASIRSVSPLISATGLLVFLCVQLLCYWHLPLLSPLSLSLAASRPPFHLASCLMSCGAEYMCVCVSASPFCLVLWLPPTHPNAPGTPTGLSCSCAPIVCLFFLPSPCFTLSACEPSWSKRWK